MNGHYKAGWYVGNARSVKWHEMRAIDAVGSYSRWQRLSFRLGYFMGWLRLVTRGEEPEGRK